jgi:proteasome accessory factor A
MSAVDIQRVYCQEALHVLEDLPDSLAWAAAEWLSVLDQLERDPMALGDRLDWVAKLQLVEAFRDEERLEWDDPMLQSIDLAYSDVDPDAGLYHGLEQEGQVVRLVDEGRIERAMLDAPGDTRAAVRGALVERFSEDIESISWGGLAVRDGAERVVVEIGVLGPQASARYAEAVRRAGGLRSAIAALAA